VRAIAALSWLEILPLVGACDHPSALSAPPVGSAARATQPTASVSSAQARGDETADEEPGSEGDETALPRATRDAVAGDSPGAFLGEIDRELGRMRASTYSHRTSIDEASGAYHYDCSGFVGYALEGSAPSAFDELRAATSRRPLARDFQQFFASLPSRRATHWARVARVSELQPGDVVAWLKVPGSTSKNTGHVVVVHGPVTPEGEDPGSYLVPIADSTALRHGRTDSRFASKATGLGTGTLVLVADPGGAPVAYRWSLEGRSRQLATTFAMGRLQPRMPSTVSSAAALPGPVSSSTRL
jgi:cell wall-associated NlpC family hydrolase